MQGQNKHHICSLFTIMTFAICLGFYPSNAVFGAEGISKTADKLVRELWHEPSYWKIDYYQAAGRGSGITVNIGRVIAEQTKIMGHTTTVGRIVLVAVKPSHYPGVNCLVLSVEKTRYSLEDVVQTLVRVIEVPLPYQGMAPTNEKTEIFIGNVVDEDSPNDSATIGAKISFSNYSFKEQTIEVSLTNIPTKIK